MTVTPAHYAKYLESCQDDLFGANGEQDVPVPAKVCVAMMSLIQYLTEDLPNGLPQELHPPAIRINNTLGKLTPRLLG